MGSEHINQKRYDAFKELNCELIGMSVDQVFSHIKWEEWIKEKLSIEMQLPNALTPLLYSLYSTGSEQYNYKSQLVHVKQTFIYCRVIILNVSDGDLSST